VTADLSGVLAKLRRADEHRQAYDDLFEEYAASEPYGILSEYDPETGWHTLLWNVSREPPLEDLALVFGDMISNLRATLDYLVWQLVLAAGKRPGRRTSFPVVRREKDWEVQSRSALSGVEPEWVEEIESRQPYHRPERPHLHPLAILEHVNNLTKHRFLPSAMLSVERIGLLVNVEPAGGEPLEMLDYLDRPITPGGELARFRVPSGVFLEVAVNQAPHVRISVDDGLEYPWHPIELVEWVGETVAAFAPAFQR
jgi:hypothetical protein